MSDKETRKYALIIATMSSFLTPFMGSSINIALPAIQKNFSIDAVLLSWVATAYLLTSSVTLIPLGRLADIYGRKRIFATGTAIFTVTSLLAALADSAVTLIVVRGIQGVGAAMIFATGIAILTSVYPPEKRGHVLGINVAVVYTGLSAGPFLGGLLTQYLGWRSIFLVNVPVGVAIIFMILTRLKGEWADASGEPFDIPGFLLYSMSLGLFMYGLSNLHSYWAAGFILAGMTGAAALVRRMKRVPHPLVDLNLFQHNRVFVFSNLAALIHYSATFAMAFLLSLYLQYIKGLSPQSAGLILVCQPVVMAVLSPLAGWISDRADSRCIASSGMTVTFVCLVFFAFLDENSSVICILILLSITGLGFALFSSPNTNAIMGSVAKKYYGLASGAAGTMRLLGMMASMAVVTVVLSVIIGRIEITPSLFPRFLVSLRVAFMVFAVFCFCGIFASLARGKVYTGKERGSQRQ